MTREVSRRLSYDPVLKGAIRPDIIGERQLDPNQVDDRHDKVPYDERIERTRKAAIERYATSRRGTDMNNYLGSIVPTDGAARTTGYRDNNNAQPAKVSKRGSS